MAEQTLNKRLRQTFERTLLAWLVSPQQTETVALLQGFAGYLSRWSDVTEMAVHAHEVCQMAVAFVSSLAEEETAQDRETQLLFRQLGKCLLHWGQPLATNPEPSQLEVRLMQDLRARQVEGREQTSGQRNKQPSNFGLIVERMLEESKTWLDGSVSDPNQLSRALAALKGLAEHHQDQRIMELAWATANMLDRLTDGTLQVNDEFQAVVERSTRLLLIAYVFQTWTTEDEVEYAKTLEDADILASGGELKSLG